MKKIIKVYKNKLFSILSLLFLWGILTIWYILTVDTSFSIWSSNHGTQEIQSLNYELIGKEETVKGQFIAQDNNLGIIAVRFQTYIRPPYKYEDHLLFKLKESGSNNWYYESTYRSGLVYDVSFFPFGFPQITDSKGKTYQFEITSLNRNDINGISVNNRFPIFQSKYKYSRSELLDDKKNLVEFIVLKFTNAFKTPDVVFASFTYLLPFIFSIAWIVFLEKSSNKIINKIRKYFFGLLDTKIGFLINFLRIVFGRLDNIIICVVLLDILFFQAKNSIIYLLILILWIKILRLYSKESTKSFIIGLSFLVLCPIMLFFDLGPIAENFGAWACIFIISGLIQEMLNKKNMVKPKYD